MATYLQQNLHFHPCQQSMVKKSFEQVLKDIGAKKAPNYGQQCWQLKKDVIFYSVRNTKTGVTLVYKIYEEEEFFEEKAQKVRTRINDKVKESFPPQKEASEQLSLRSDKFAAYTIGEDIENNGGSFFQNHPWVWYVIFGICMVTFGLITHPGIFSSSSSKSNSNDPAYYYGTWSSPNGTIEVTFRNDMTAKCKVILGGEPIEWTTKWAVSPDNGVFWGTYYGRGEYSFMTPDGHQYGYNENYDRYTDEEVYLHKK